MSAYGLRIVEWSVLDAMEQSALLKRPVNSEPKLLQQVADIIHQVREQGDDALARFSLQFDGAKLESVEVPADALRAARQAIDARLSQAINDASARIRMFHAADVPTDKTVETAAGLECTVTYRPLSKVGIYVPGGTAPLISTVLMLAIPARLAGCREIIMCSPPGRDGRISTEVLAAASFCDVDRVFCVGGAQAVAAMAYGTDSVPRCNKIFGPGNSWVTAAKQQVSLDPDGAAIDMPAGPSEVMVIASASAGKGKGVDFICWDLLSQAEHGPDSQVLLLTDSRNLASEVIARLDELASTTARHAILDQSLRAARVILVDDLQQALEIANEYAPEHLILNTENARELSKQVEHAGSVFIGPWTPESLGDYCSGTNHVLPTHGFARAHGALGVSDFMRRMTLQEASAAALAQVGPTAEILAEIEGLDAHRMAVRSPAGEHRMSVLDLARPDIVAMKPNSSARNEAPAEGVLLNANESPWPLFDNQTSGYALNRYPDPQPPELIANLARHYAVDANQVLVTRGSDEGIDLLTRVFCRAGQDAILHCPPTFGMYRIAAQIQGAAVISVERNPSNGFVMDTGKVLEAVRHDSRIRLVFLTSPNNPTGDCVSESFLRTLLETCEQRAMVVIDEAYAEFCEQASFIPMIAGQAQLVILRTLSKAWASAGLRCGTVLAQPQTIDLLRRVIAPYPLASPITALANRVLQPEMVQRQQEQLAELRANKDILISLLNRYSLVLELFPGEANFVLLKVRDAKGLVAHCARHGVIVRAYTNDSVLQDYIRISVGSKPDLAALEQALNLWEVEQT